MDKYEKAFEYVLGSLRGYRRDQFEQAMAHDKSLRVVVAFWEEQLMALNRHQNRPPYSDTWQKIGEHY